MRKLDTIDRTLLELLQGDDRLPLAQLSQHVGAPASTISDRIRRLKREGLIAGFQARLSPDALGLTMLAFMLVGWSNPRIEQVFLKRITALPVVLECHRVTGAWNYLLKLRLANTRDLERFLVETIKSISGIERTEAVIVLSSAKETWLLPVPEA